MRWATGCPHLAVLLIDTIVAEVQGVPGDDRCVLLLGYRQDMEAMVRNANPGSDYRGPFSLFSAGLTLCQYCA